MADWTVEQVAEWLRKEGFGQFSQAFKGKSMRFEFIQGNEMSILDRRIDGAALSALQTETIRELLPDQQLIEQFKQKLHEWKRNNVSSTDRESYTKSITLSTDKIDTNVKFFTNPSFRSRFQQYLPNIDCQIRLLESQEIYLTLSGSKPNVKAAREMISRLFESVQTKTYDDEQADQQSKSSHPQSPISIFQFQ